MKLKDKKVRRLKMEKGVCSWCTKRGIISYMPLETNFQDPRMNICVENMNAGVWANKLIKIAKGIFACKECVSAYGLRPTE
jgi:hypothetical protein